MPVRTRYRKRQPSTDSLEKLIEVGAIELPPDLHLAKYLLFVLAGEYVKRLGKAYANYQGK
jgi:hypothetical protein